MIGNFTKELNGAVFEFHTMNVNRLQLFQVYVQYEGKKHRFHMQRRDKGDFYITDIDKVPLPYRELGPELNVAILAYGETVSV
jgi:hypothetical protein